MTWSLDKATSEDTDADVSGQLEDHQAGSNFQAVDIVRSSEEPMASCFGSAEIFFAACHQQDIVFIAMYNFIYIYILIYI